MRLPRYSLAGLMGVVVFCALAFAGLKQASELWSSVFFTATLAVLLAAILGLVLSRGRRRAGWLGFMVFGWGYMIVSFYVWPQPAAPAGAPTLVTTRLLNELYPRLHPAPAQDPTALAWNSATLQPVQAPNAANFFTAQPASNPVGGWNPTQVQPAASTLATFVLASAGGNNSQPFHVIGHCLGAVLAGLGGMLVARIMFARKERSQEPEQPVPVAAAPPG